MPVASLSRWSRGGGAQQVLPFYKRTIYKRSRQLGKQRGGRGAGIPAAGPVASLMALRWGRGRGWRSRAGPQLPDGPGDEPGQRAQPLGLQPPPSRTGRSCPSLRGAGAGAGAGMAWRSRGEGEVLGGGGSDSVRQVPVRPRVVFPPVTWGGREVSALRAGERQTHGAHNPQHTHLSPLGCVSVALRVCVSAVCGRAACTGTGLRPQEVLLQSVPRAS